MTNSPTANAHPNTHQIRQLAARSDPRTPGGPPWAWPNLTTQEAECLDIGLDEFVDTYNRIHAHAVDDVVPQCWRLHPALAQELPVQFWAWSAAHLDEQSTILTALEYYNRHLPAFQTRLSSKLLGKGAVNCRKGHHTNTSDPAVVSAISFNLIETAGKNGRCDTTRRVLRGLVFGAR